MQVILIALRRCKADRCTGIGARCRLGGMRQQSDGGALLQKRLTGGGHRPRRWTAARGPWTLLRCGSLDWCCPALSTTAIPTPTAGAVLIRLWKQARNSAPFSQIRAFRCSHGQRQGLPWLFRLGACPGKHGLEWNHFTFAFPRRVWSLKHVRSQHTTTEVAGPVMGL